MVQWLRFHSSTARRAGFILDQGNKILSSMDKKLKKKKKVDIVVRAEESGNYFLLSESETSFCEDCII